MLNNARQVKIQLDNGEMIYPEITYTDESDFDAKVAQYIADNGGTYLGEYQEL